MKNHTNIKKIIPESDLKKSVLDNCNFTYMHATKNILDHIIKLKPNTATLKELRRHLEEKYPTRK